MLRRQFELDDDALEKIVGELVAFSASSDETGTRSHGPPQLLRSATTAACSRPARLYAQAARHEDSHFSLGAGGRAQVGRVALSDVKGSMDLAEQVDALSGAPIAHEDHRSPPSSHTSPHGRTAIRLSEAAADMADADAVETGDEAGGSRRCLRDPEAQTSPKTLRFRINLRRDWKYARSRETTRRIGFGHGDQHGITPR
jgi:hypothetical protein